MQRSILHLLIALQKQKIVQTDKYKILCIDNDISHLSNLSERLVNSGFIALISSRRDFSIDTIKKNNIELIILGIHQFDELNELSLIKQDRSVSDIPVFVYSTINDEYFEITVFKNGAEDFITFPLKMMTLIARIDAFFNRKYKVLNNSIIRANGLEINPNETGLEMKFIKNRLGLDFTYFKYLDGPRIFDLTLPESTGYSSLTTNGIKSERSGFEIALTGTPIKNANGFTWDVLANWSQYQERLREIYGDQTRLNQFYKVGDRLDKYFGRAFVRSADGQIVNDKSGRPIYNPVAQFLGYTNPDWAFGFYNKLSYKNFSLTAQIDGRIGGVIENYIQKQTFRGGRHIKTVEGAMGIAREKDTQGIKSWVGEGVVLVDGTIKYDPDGNVTNLNELKFEPISATYATFLQDYISRYYNSNEGNMINRSFGKLRELQLGYDIPSRILGNRIQKATISIVGRNLLYFAHAKDLDVEQFVDYTDRSSAIQSPTLRRYGVNINFVF